MRTKITDLKIPFLLLLLTLSANTFAATFTIEAETMTTSGRYAGTVSSPFSGIALYANADQGEISQPFADGDGYYLITLTGASNNSSAAGVSLYINGVKIKAYTFYGTAASNIEATVTLSGLSQSNTVTLILETDNGSSDTYIDKIVFDYQGPIVVKNPPTIPAQGAYYTGTYRNMLSEAGYSDAQISQKLNNLWNHYFYGDSATQALYYPVGTDEAYILDVNNGDIRSEGMSYGMMICVQMNKQTEFNRLWKWMKTRMQIQSGTSKGYFAWQMLPDGSSISSQTAPDGDEYIAMALMFAAGRWGNGSGIYNYWQEANDILENSISKAHYINASITNMFNETEQQVVFVPYASSARHTDPSYHLPAFYQLWSMWTNTKRKFWNGLADKSRDMFPLFANATTGLMPDYANFDGTATGSSHADFRYDAWRCIMNMAVDYSWFKADETEVDLINRIHNFFSNEGIESYGSEYSLAGQKLNTDHSPGLVACNAAGTLASNQSVAWDFIDNFFQTGMSSGQYRYYDGMLYFLNYLLLSGNYKIYTPSDVLVTALDERYEYSADYLLLNDFEQQTIGDTYFMRQTEGSLGSAAVVANPSNATEKSLQILPGNYDEYLYYEYTLPEGRTLATDYLQMEFDIFYDVTGNNQNQTLKIDFDAIGSTPFFSTSTGAVSTHGQWNHITVPLSGNTAGNSFKFLVCVRTRDANYYIDNVKLKMNYVPITALQQYDGEISDINYANGHITGSNMEKLQVYNVHGSLVASYSNATDIDMTAYPAGVYILQVQQKDKTYIKKIIK